VEHNWVLANSADVLAVGPRGACGRRLANDYVAPGYKRVLSHTKTIAAGAYPPSVTFATSILKRVGAYQYLCTFPSPAINALITAPASFWLAASAPARGPMDQTPADLLAPAELEVTLEVNLSAAEPLPSGAPRRLFGGRCWAALAPSTPPVGVALCNISAAARISCGAVD